jgi:hypothetical protein
MVTTTRPQETREQMLRRLANKAREHGVRLMRDKTGRHFASSVSQPGTWHYVTAVSCDCIGFHRHQRCMHHAALLSALGWVGDEPAPEPEPTVCQSCKGRGSTSGTELYMGRRMDILITCWHCRGTGREQLAA